MEPIRIAVTGGAGQISYSLLFRLASGELFPGRPISLHILELPEALGFLEGVKMELEDSAFPLLQEIRIGTDPHKIFEGVNLAFLVGAKPRQAGMERKDLLLDNGKIFVSQGKALSDVAAKDIRVLVIGNPCNTNCLIAIHNAPNIPHSRFHAMTRLDQNRAISLLANKTAKATTSVKRMTIWGNHSSTQVPDPFYATIDGVCAAEVIGNRAWLEKEFLERVQQRGAEIIKARGKSSAASAASAAIDAMRALFTKTSDDDTFSTACLASENRYGIDNSLVFSFPCKSDEFGECSLVQGIEWNAWLKEKIFASEKELKEERDLVLQFLRR